MNPRAGRLSGGGSASALWSKIVASVLGIPLERTESQEGSAFGAALLAGVRSGAFADVEEAVARCVRVRDRVEPEPEWMELYERGYGRHARALPGAATATGTIGADLANRPDDRRAGGRRLGAVARAGAGGRGGRPGRAVSLRSLPLDSPRRSGGLARCLGDLAALAARTRRIRLGTLVSPTTFRPASVLAKNVVTVDHISGGRVELGIGAGWFEPDHTPYGFTFGTVGERMTEFERQLEEIDRQWSTAAEIWPKPLQRPRPPIIVGGGASPQRPCGGPLRRRVQHGRADARQARERSEIVRRAAEQAGRAPLRFSMMASCALGRDEAEVNDRLRAWDEASTLDHRPELAGTVEQVAEILAQYEAAGVQRAMLQHLAHEDVEMVASLGELARELAG